MAPLLFAVGALALTMPLVIGLMRINELFLVRVHHGNARLVRGRAPQRLFDDLADILARPVVGRATLRAVSEDRRPRLYAEGDLSVEQKQRLRNVIGTWTVQQIRTAPPRRRRA